MKNLITLTSFIILLISSIKSQNNFLIDDNVYPCSDTYLLKPNSEMFPSDGLNLTIAKDNNRAMLIFSIKFFFGDNPDVRVAGSIFLYLEDNTIIKCKDTGKFDVIDDVVTTIYTITNDQLNKLKLTDINKVRYSLRCIKCISSSLEGKYSATNDIVYFPNVFKELFE